MNKILCNVTSVKTNYQDRGILILDVFVDLETGGGLSVFNMVLDTYDKEKKERAGTAYGCEMIRQTLQFFGVNDLSEIKNYKCYLLTHKESIWNAGDVLGIENFDFPQYKHHRKSIIKSEVLEQFGEKA